jgi:hypothetical protein
VIFVIYQGAGHDPHENQYLACARECTRLALHTDNDDLRDQLLQMARDWMVLRHWIAAQQKSWSGVNAAASVSGPLGN